MTYFFDINRIFPYYTNKTRLCNVYTIERAVYNIINVYDSTTKPLNITLYKIIYNCITHSRRRIFKTTINGPNTQVTSSPTWYLPTLYLPCASTDTNATICNLPDDMTCVWVLYKNYRDICYKLIQSKSFIAKTNIYHIIFGMSFTHHRTYKSILFHNHNFKNMDEN